MLQTVVSEVDLTLVVPGDNDRKTFEPNALRDLADSMDKNGLAQPVTLRPVTRLDGQMFEIVAGERRVRAAQLLGWRTIPAIVRGLSDREASAIMLSENTSRANLNPIEEARAYQKRIGANGPTEDEVAKMAGVSIDLIRRRLSLLALADDVQHLVASGQFPIGHAEALTQLDHNRQMIALRVFGKSSGMPLATFRGFVGQLLEEQAQDALFDLEGFWTQVVEQQKEIPRRGKHALTGAPIRSDLPPIEIRNDDTVGQVVDRYIAQLLRSGLTLEASTIGTVYNVLVHHNFVATPVQSVLLTDASEASHE
jgi:ParB/RepB/Spo0J family partition protein